MGLLDQYKSNLGRQWSAAAPDALIYDFDQHALMGVRIGAPLSLLWHFGPPEDKSKIEEGIYRYYSKGVEIITRATVIDGFTLFLIPSPEEQYMPFRGVFRQAGSSLHIKPGMTEDQLVSIFQDPLWKEEDAQEIILFYQRHAVQWQCEISNKRGLEVISISALHQIVDHPG